MAFKKFVFSVFAAALLSACSSTWDVESVRKMRAQGSLFDKALKHEYTELASAERAEGDWRDAATFIERAKASAVGISVEPEHVWARKLPGDRIGELRSARVRLVRALDGGARIKMPEEAAWAQAGFDCWMQELEENLEDGDIQACRKSYDAAMDLLERKHIAPPYAYKTDKTVIFFDFGSIKIQDKAWKLLDEIVAAYKRTNPTNVLVSGHTDRVGTNQNNVKLSKKRAKAVSKALSEAGVPAAKIKIQAFGEYQPAVPTADEVKESRNRRVEVSFQQ